MRLAGWLLLLAVVWCPAARAQAPPEHPLDKSLQTCQDKNPSTAGEVECIGAASALWDRELNRVYKELNRRLGAQGKQSLKAAQSEWLKQRDSEFRLIDSLYAKLEGTMYIPMRAYSRMKVVRARALTLNDYLQLLEEHQR